MNITQAPWQVSLQTSRYQNQFCGGSIIGDRWILTAAHCLRSSTKSYKVVVGATHKYTEGIVLDVQEAIRHDNYSAASADNDFALLKLAKPLQYTNAVQPIRLPNVGDAPPTPGTLCLVSGWGYTANPTESEDILRGVEVPIVEQRKCAKAYPTRPVTANMICAGFDMGDKDCKISSR